MLKINGNSRLTAFELSEYKKNSGITDLQYEIVKRRYFDGDEPTVVSVCMSLNISQRKYVAELNKAIKQIEKYEEKRV